MKRTSGILCVAASAFLMCVAGASATYESQSFDAGAPPYGDWSSGSSYSTSLAHSVNALAIPGQTTVSNGLPDIATKVWTDFWTIPTLYTNGTVTAPDIDTSATAQFFVNAASNWVAFSGNGVGVYKTNVLDSVLSGTGAYPKAPNGLNFFNVSILSDYGTHTYSLFVNGNCLATNLAFICGVPGDTVRWFQVQNLAQSSSETCILDEYSLTNKLSSAAMSEPITGGGISQSDAVYYFGTPEPKPVNTNASSTENSATWNFSGVETPYTSYKVLGSASSSGPFVLIGDMATGPDMTRNEIGSNSRYYYKVVRVSTNDPSVSVTNTEVYAAYKRPRAASGLYLAGVSVAFPTSSEATFRGALGNQLKQGLGLGDQVQISATDTNGDTFVFDYEPATSGWNSSTPNALDKPFMPGSSLFIQTGAGIGGNNMVLAGTKPQAAITLKVPNGWSYLAWASVDDTVTDATLGGVPGLDAALGEYLYYQTVGSTTINRSKNTSLGWRNGVRGTGTPVSFPIKAGDGIIYKNTSGSPKTWTQPQP